MGSDGQAKTFPYRSIWQTEVALRLEELEDRSRALPDAAPSPQPKPEIDETVTAHTAASDLSIHVTETPRSVAGIAPELGAARKAAVESAIEEAKSVITEAQTANPLQRLKAWWTGTAVTSAWDLSHEAESQLVDVEREEDVRASLPRLLAWVRAVMPSGDQRKRYVNSLGDYIDGKKPVDRTVVRQARYVAGGAGDTKYGNLREYRNQIVIATIVLGLLLSAVAIWHAANPHFISLCHMGQNSEGNATSAAGQESEGNEVCIDGTDTPQRADIAEILLVGAVGGALSIAFDLGRTAEEGLRVDPRRAQRALKIVSGAATALIGVIFIQTELLIAPTNSESAFLALGYAALFGFSQQLLTQFVDKRGEKLVGEKDESDSDSAKTSTG